MGGRGYEYFMEQHNNTSHALKMYLPAVLVKVFTFALESKPAVHDVCFTLL